VIPEYFTDDHGWRYAGNPADGEDCRALVWLQDRKNGMEWCGLRAWGNGRWMNGGEPELAMVLCWQPLPKPPLKMWDRGILKECLWMRSKP
jgi:hypothetical protein